MLRHFCRFGGKFVYFFILLDTHVAGYPVDGDVIFLVSIEEFSNGETYTVQSLVFPTSLLASLDTSPHVHIKIYCEPYDHPKMVIVFLDT